MIIHRGYVYREANLKQPTQEMLDFFKQRTRQHIDRVVKYMDQLHGTEGVNDTELDEPIRQCLAF
jgi:hypothetical protein